MTAPTRKPRIALMGEFSSGKSTLSNLMLGARPLPEKVTATRLSPVWMSYGTEPAYRVDMDGSEEPVDIQQLETVDVDATRVIHLFFEADILEVCDLIDFPGISDPNMSSEVWQRMLSEVDAVLWCTHATQAWRQSEAAVWEAVPDAVKERSVLLVTKFDKLITERDRYRVLARLGKETEGQFAALFPISLTKALAAGDDYDAFTASGGGAFLEHLINLVEELNAAVGEMSHSVYQAAMGGSTESADEPEGEIASVAPTASFETDDDVAVAQIDTATPMAAQFDEVQPATADEGSNAVAFLKPVVDVSDSEPVEFVESAMPIEENPEPAEDAPVIIPRRVRPSGNTQSARPRRPVAVRKLAPGDADMSPSPMRPTKPADPNQLRAIFSVENETT